MSYLYDNLIDKMINNPFETEKEILKDLSDNYNISVVRDDAQNYSAHNEERNFILLFFDKGLNEIDKIILKSNIQISVDKITYNECRLGYCRIKNIKNPEITYLIHMPDIFYYLIRKDFYQMISPISGKIKRVDRNLFKITVSTRYNLLSKKAIANYIMDSIKSDLKSFIYRDENNIKQAHEYFGVLVEELKKHKDISQSYSQFITELNRKLRGIVKIKQERILKTILIDDLYNINLVEVSLNSVLKIFLNDKYKKMQHDIEHTIKEVEKARPRILPHGNGYSFSIYELDTNNSVNFNIYSRCCKLKFDDKERLKIAGNKNISLVFNKIENINKQVLSKVYQFINNKQEKINDISV